MQQLKNKTKSIPFSSIQLLPELGKKNGWVHGTHPVHLFPAVGSPNGRASDPLSPRPAGGAAAVARPDANEPGGPAPCRKWLRRGRALREGPGGRAGVMAATEAAAAASAAPAPGVPAMPTSMRGAAAAASGPWGPSESRLQGSRPRPARARAAAVPVPPARELIQPSVSELSRAVRTNILCTVRGCGKILPNSPALNMHLVKSHRLQVSWPRWGARGLRGLRGTRRPAPDHARRERGARTRTGPAASWWRAHNTTASCLLPGFLDERQVMPLRHLCATPALSAPSAKPPVGPTRVVIQTQL